MTVARKKNVAGYIDEMGRFRPIRSPKFVGSPQRKATRKQKAKYSRAKAGDLGKARQERALEDVFDREIRLQKESSAKAQKEKEKVWREILNDVRGDADSDGPGRTLMQFVRDSGGIRRTYAHGGSKYRGKRVGHDADEINRLSYKETGKRGLTTDKGGKTLDGMYQAARESGYDVADMWDMVSRIEQEAKGGNATYATHGFLDYRDNPKLPKTQQEIMDRMISGEKLNYSATGHWRLDSSRGNVLVNQRAAKALKEKQLIVAVSTTGKYTNYEPVQKNPKSDLFIAQLGMHSYGVFLKTYLLKKFRTKLAAERYRDSIRARAKTNPSKAKFKIGDRVYSYWNKTTPATIGQVVFDEVAGYQYALNHPTLGRRWVGEKNVAKSKRAKVVTNPFPSKLAKAAISAFDTDYDMDLDANDIRRLKKGEKRLAKKPAAKTPARSRGKKNPLDPLAAVATGLSSVVSALTIKKMMAEDTAKKVMKRKTPAKRKTNGRTTAKRRPPIKNPLTKYARKEPTTDSYAANKMDTVFYSDPAGKKFYARMPWYQSGHPTKSSKTVVLNTFRWSLKWLPPIKKARKNPPRTAKKAATPKRYFLMPFIDGVYLSNTDGELGRKFRTQKAAREYAKKMGIRISNPAAAFGSKAAGSTKRKKVNPFTKNVGGAQNALSYGYTVDEAKKAGHSLRDLTLAIRQLIKGGHKFQKRQVAGLNSLGFSRYELIGQPRATAKANPKTTAKRRTYEMFQGRPASMVRPLQVSRHAPAKMDQLGDLIEIKLADGRILNPNPKRFKLCAAGGKLWIAGGKFAKENPASKTNELNAVERIEHVVYGTYKPHHGDNNYTHYIHKLGEETGHMPMLAVDREGFPVIRGGRYKIEARGIVN